MTSTSFKLKLRAFAILGTAMGIVVLYLSIRGPSSFPERQTLKSVAGPVAWTSPDRYSINFAVAGDPRTFSYAYKSGDRDAVASALSDASKHPITILVDPNDPQRGTSGGPFFQVYELSSGQARIRSYAQVKHAWASDYRYGCLAAFLAFLAAGFLEYAARRVPLGNPSEPESRPGPTQSWR